MSQVNTIEIVSERLLSSVPHAVFTAFADPRLLARWWGPEGFTNQITRFDFTPGGEWLVTMTSSGGTDFENRWTFEEIQAPRRILAVHHEPMHVFSLDITFDDHDGGTRLVWLMTFEDTTENREIQRFIAAANQQNFDRLEALLDSI